jgi:hypothetical protein
LREYPYRGTFEDERGAFNKEESMITVRFERPEEIPDVRIINGQAFGRPAEVDVVDRLRWDCLDCLSSWQRHEGSHASVPVMAESAAAPDPRRQNQKTAAGSATPPTAVGSSAIDSRT